MLELTWQLRGTADKRQVEGVNAALQHNIGLGGAAVVTAYQRAERLGLSSAEQTQNCPKSPTNRQVCACSRENSARQHRVDQAA